MRKHPACETRGISHTTSPPANAAFPAKHVVLITGATHKKVLPNCLHISAPNEHMATRHHHDHDALVMRNDAKESHARGRQDRCGWRAPARGAPQWVAGPACARTRTHRKRSVCDFGIDAARKASEGGKRHHRLVRGRSGAWDREVQRGPGTLWVLIRCPLRSACVHTPFLPFLARRPIELQTPVSPHCACNRRPNGGGCRWESSL